MNEKIVTEGQANDAGYDLEEATERLNWCLTYTPDEDADAMHFPIAQARAALDTMEQYFKPRAEAGRR